MEIKARPADRLGPPDPLTHPTASGSIRGTQLKSGQPMDDWIDYYDSTHTIYVSKRHRDVHFRLIARDIALYIPSADATVLDYSCGEALFAADVAAACGKLILAEPAPGVRGRLSARFASNPKIKVRSLDDLAQLPDASVGLAVMISVAQYMTPAELDSALAVIQRDLPSNRLSLRAPRQESAAPSVPRRRRSCPAPPPDPRSRSGQRLARRSCARRSRPP